MDRTTREQLYDRINYLREQGHDLAINFQRASGWRGRITTSDQSRDRSPRLKVGELYLWLEGYLDGYSSGKAFTIQSAPK